MLQHEGLYIRQLLMVPGLLVSPGTRDNLYIIYAGTEEKISDD